MPLCQHCQLSRVSDSLLRLQVQPYIVMHVSQCLLQAQGLEEDQSLKGSARGHSKTSTWHVSLCHYAWGSRVYTADTWRPSGTWRHLGLKTGETEVQRHVTWEIELNKLNLCFYVVENRLAGAPGVLLQSMSLQHYHWNDMKWQSISWNLRAMNYQFFLGHLGRT